MRFLVLVVLAAAAAAAGAQPSRGAATNVGADPRAFAVPDEADFVVIDRTRASHWRLSVRPRDGIEQMMAIAQGTRGAYEVIGWSAFAASPRRYLAALIVKDEYPGADLGARLVALLDTFSEPVGVTWNGGIATTGEERVQAERMHALFLKSPSEYEAARIGERDLLHPDRHGALPWWKCQGRKRYEIPPPTEEAGRRLLEFLDARFPEELTRADLVRRFGRPLRIRSEKLRSVRELDFGQPVLVTTWQFAGMTLTTIPGQSASATHHVIGGEASAEGMELGQGLATGQAIDQWVRMLGRPEDCGAGGRFRYQDGGTREMRVDIDGLGRVMRLEWSVFTP